MSGAKASRPELLKALARVRRGDVLVVARLDRLARSLSHLLSVIAELDAKGAHFKSLADPIDTTTPQGRFALQVLGAVAELERALIQERTKDGLRAAKRRGRVGGNPKLRAGDRDAINEVDAKAKAYFERVNRTAEHWLPIVKEMRPDHRWQDVVRVLNAKREPSRTAPCPSGASKFETRGQTLRRGGPRRSSLLHPARRNFSSERLVTLVAGVNRANPELTLAQIGAQLEAMYERTPRGGTRWCPSSVKSLLDRARKLGLLAAEKIELRRCGESAVTPPFAFSRGFRRLPAQQRHQHGTERELPCPRFRGQNPQIAAGAFDFLAALQDRGDDDRRIVFAQNLQRLRPGVRRHANGPPHHRRGYREIAPRVDPALRQIEDIGTGLQHHAERIGFGRQAFVRLWTFRNGWAPMEPRVLVVEPERFAPAFLKARFKIRNICNLILYVALSMGLIGALFWGFT